jgi:hypothetical protein
MEPAELDEALEDLETRLERLRALYEQYFLGIEKVPPAVARTDVDRRIWTLRKVQIRNTAKRYKLQTIVQRYNTFQQYWARICREIEDGTYSPHVARARKQLDPDKALTIATRRRLGMYRQSSAPPAEDAREKALREAEAELAAALVYPGRPPTADLAQDPREKVSAPARARSSAGPEKTQARPTTSMPADAKTQARPTTSMPADAWRDPRDKVSSPAPTSAQPQGPGAPPPPSSRKPQDLSGARSDRTADSSGQLSPRPPPPPRSPPLPASLAPGVRRSPPLEPVTLQFAPQPAASRAESPAAPAPPPPWPRTAGVQAGRLPPIGNPEAARQGRSPHAPSPVGHAPPERASAGQSTGLTATGVEQLHRQLVEAKRRNHDESHVDLDELRTRLQKAERQLRTQHGDRPIEFAVVVKNGRAMIKPTVR